MYIHTPYLSTSRVVDSPHSGIELQTLSIGALMDPERKVLYSLARPSKPQGNVPYVVHTTPTAIISRALDPASPPQTLSLNRLQGAYFVMVSREIECFCDLPVQYGVPSSL